MQSLKSTHLLPVVTNRMQPAEGRLKLGHDGGGDFRLLPPLDTAPAAGASAIEQPMLLASSKLSKKQIADLELLSKVATDPQPKPGDVQRARVVLLEYRVPADELRQLRNTARTVASNYLDNPRNNIQEHAKKWGTYNDQQKRTVIEGFLNSANETTNQNIKLRFNSIPTVNGLMNNGSYDAKTNTINLNAKSDTLKNLGSALAVTYHEFIHASYYQQTKHLDPYALIEEAKIGYISFSQSLAAFNLTERLYLSPEKNGFKAYTLNPHEQLADTGMHLFRHELLSRKIATPPVFKPGSPVHDNMKRHGLK